MSIKSAVILSSLKINWFLKAASTMLSPMLKVPIETGTFATVNPVVCVREGTPIALALASAPSDGGGGDEDEDSRRLLHVHPAAC
jgi:hypothetical protein